jgi:hypothetical protein
MLIEDIINDDKFDREEQAMGLSTLYNDNYQLAGGFRSGSSPAGTTRLKYVIYSMDLFQRTNDPKKSEIGFVELFANDENGNIEGLVNIELKPKFRKSGHGKVIIQDLIDTVDDGLNIHDIQKKASGFWKKMGTEFDHKAVNRGLTGIQGRISKN